MTDGWMVEGQTDVKVEIVLCGFEKTKPFLGIIFLIKTRVQNIIAYIMRQTVITRIQ